MVRKTIGPAFCLIASVVLISRAQAPLPAAAFDLDEMTVAQLQDAMASGRYTSRRLVELYTGRINAIDRDGPALRSVIELNPDAVSIAERSTPSASLAGCGDLCTASRYSSRTTSIRATG
jgi:hypothetical protein